MNSQTSQLHPHQCETPEANQSRKPAITSENYKHFIPKEGKRTRAQLTFMNKDMHNSNLRVMP